jgi:tripartite-type tricarboxylate transporter receptor subunit TctC
VLFGPANLPPPILDRLNRAVRDGLAETALVDGLARVGVTPRPSSPAAGTSFVAAELEKWARVVKDAHIEPN